MHRVAVQDSQGSRRAGDPGAHRPEPGQVRRERFGLDPRAMQDWEQGRRLFRPRCPRPAADDRQAPRGRRGRAGRLIFPGYMERKGIGGVTISIRRIFHLCAPPNSSIQNPCPYEIRPGTTKIWRKLHLELIILCAIGCKSRVELSWL